MSLIRCILAALLVLGFAGEARAQSTSAPSNGPAFDPNALPLDYERLQRALRQATVREERSGLNLRYTVEVFGQAPPIVLLRPEDNLTTGPVPYGAPTHRQLVDHNTPIEFRSPRMDVSALMRWLADRAKR